MALDVKGIVNDIPSVYCFLYPKDIKQLCFTLVHRSKQMPHSDLLEEVHLVPNNMESMIELNVGGAFPPTLRCLPNISDVILIFQ